MLHPLEHIGDHQNPLTDTTALASRQAPQFGRPRFAAKKICRHRRSPKHGILLYKLYHIWRSPEAGITFAGAQKWSIQNTRDDDWPFSDEVRPGAERQSEVDRRYGDHEISAARCVRCVHEP